MVNSKRYFSTKEEVNHNLSPELWILHLHWLHLLNIFCSFLNLKTSDNDYSATRKYNPNKDDEETNVDKERRCVSDEFYNRTIFVSAQGVSKANLNHFS